MGGADCELLRDGWLAQPANAWSNAAYLAAAAWVLTRRRAVGRLPPEVLVGAAALALVAVASGAYHGPQPDWAEAGHDASIAALVAAVAVHAVAEVWRRRWRWGRLSRTDAVALVALGCGVSLYVLGRTGGPLCAPASLLQPHAGWHLASAVAAAAALTPGAARPPD